MIKKYNDFKSEKNSAPREILPAGGYVSKIISAKVESYDWGDVLILAYDITEGEFANFFRRDYDNNPNEDKKWRGTLRLNIPNDSNDQKNEWRKRTFNNFVACVEESNDGYHWDWDETKLKNKAIGILVRDREWEMNGNTGWTTEACNAASVEQIREGKYRTPKPYALRKKAETAVQSFLSTGEIADDGDLPF